MEGVEVHVVVIVVGVELNSWLNYHNSPVNPTHFDTDTRVGILTTYDTMKPDSYGT